MAADPNYAVPTGDFIAEWLEQSGMNAAELARRLDTTAKHVSELLSGKAPLSHRSAIALENVTGVPARIWNQYEARYREDQARLATDASLADQYDQAARFPLAYLRKHGYVTASARDRAGTVRELLALLRVASIEAWWTTWSKGSVAYRRSAAARDDAPALSVWLALGERDAWGKRCARFDEEAVRAALPQLREWTAGPAGTGMDRAARLLKDAGVVLCFLPPVPGLGIHGATRWIGGMPVVQMSLGWKTDHQMWFTLFHELGHVLLHGDKGLYVDSDHTLAEEEADTFAAEMLSRPARRR